MVPVAPAGNVSQVDVVDPVFGSGEDLFLKGPYGGMQPQLQDIENLFPGFLLKFRQSIVIPGIQYKVVNRRDGDIEQVYADTTMANKVLGWKAGIPLEETLRTAWKWEQTIRNQTG
ncbi:hypothetical protein ES708_14925 [subsurface metagenome]